jgi:hypothetical protein
MAIFQPKTQSNSGCLRIKSMASHSTSFASLLGSQASTGGGRFSVISAKLVSLCTRPYLAWYADPSMAELDASCNNYSGLTFYFLDLLLKILRQVTVGSFEMSVNITTSHP